MNYFNRIIELFTTHDVPEPDKNAFYRWITDEKHADKKTRAMKDVWRSSTAKKTSGTLASFNSVKEKAGIPATRKTIPLLRIWQAAAAVLLIISISSLYLYFSKENRNMLGLIEQYVPVAEMRQLTLPDGSEVQLNSGSVLFYPKSFDGKSRSVYLTGEANFKVKRDTRKPFIVKSTDFQVTVLGTEFDISAYPEDSIVSATVLSGSVKVEYDNLRSEVVLEPGRQLAYNKHSHQHNLDYPDMQDVTAWQRGELVFKGSTLRDIITVLERKYPYTFTYSLGRLTSDQYTFRFGEKDTLPEVMDIITRVVGNLSYKIENNTCYIY